MKKFAILFPALLLAGCIDQSWIDAKHSPQSDDTPKPQASPASQQPQSGGSAADDYKMCGNYYLGKGVPKNDAEAFQLCQSAAQQGNPNAMYNLALFYERGEGTGQNYNEAKKWFKAAASKGQPDAKYDLKQIELAEKGGMGVPAKSGGIADEETLTKTAATAGGAAAGGAGGAAAGAGAAAGGIDIAQYCLIAAERGNADPKCKADLAKQQAAQSQQPQPPQNSDLTTYLAAAKTGNPQAQNDLGVVYRRGIDGAKKNPAGAQKLFENAASKGSTNGMMNLASMYKEGDVQQNLELAYAWYDLAGDRIQPGDPRKVKAQENVQEVAKYMNNQQIGDALAYVTKLDEKIPVAEEK